MNGVTRRYLDWLCTKERAIEHAFERADELLEAEPGTGAVIVVERPDFTEERRIDISPIRMAATAWRGAS